MSKAKAMMEKLLRRKSTTGSTFFKDGVEEKQSGDLGLYVPIMKILMLLPQEELNMHISTLIVTVASTLKSRKLEERQLGNYLSKITYLKIPQNVAFENFNFGIFYQFLSN